MNCDEALLAISAALDGELSPKERAALSDHLLACPECRELAADLRVLTESLEQSEQEPPAGLAESIRAAVAEEGRKAAPLPKKKRPPYWLTAAAMLALCVCLGGIGLFASGRMGTKGGSAADGAVPAPALFQAPPENKETRSGTGGAEGSDGSAGFCLPADSGDSEAPMEPGEPTEFQELVPEEAPLPMPSVAPDLDGTADGGKWEETAPGSIGSTSNGSVGAGNEKEAALTPEEALELVFEYLGGYEMYPEALRFSTAPDGGAQEIGYTLQTVETETVRSEYCLYLVRLSADGGSYEFHLYEDVTDKETGSGHTATANWIEVSVDGGQITSMF